MVARRFLWRRRLLAFDATVIGAGIGGLTVARALALRGARVRVLEQAPAIAEVGAGIQVSPNGGRVLSAIGLDAALERASGASGAVVLRDHRKGAQVLRMDLSGKGRFALVHRADIIDLLLKGAQAAGVSIETGRRVSDVDFQRRRAVLTFEDHQSETPEGLVVGADGLHSRMRAAILGGKKPRFTGQVAWRATLAAEPGEVPSEAQVFMGPGRHVVVYPLRNGRLINIVAVEERSAWVDEGWHHVGEPETLKAAFADFGGPVSAWLKRVTQVHRWGLFQHPVARKWWKGNGVLLGDAAHPTLPFLAQGACMALEDAWVLSNAVTRHGGASQAAFAAYQMERQDRVTRIVAAATANARNYHLRNPLVRAVAHGGLRMLGGLLPGAMVQQYDWLYGHDVTGGAGS